MVKVLLFEKWCLRKWPFWQIIAKIQRDFDVIFYNLGLDIQSPIREYGVVQQDTVLGVQDALFSVQDAFIYDFEDASMTHSMTAEVGMLLGAPHPPQDWRRVKFIRYQLFGLKVSKKEIILYPKTFLFVEFNAFWLYSWKMFCPIILGLCIPFRRNVGNSRIIYSFLDYSAVKLLCLTANFHGFECHAHQAVSATPKNSNKGQEILIPK